MGQEAQMKLSGFEKSTERCARYWCESNQTWKRELEPGLREWYCETCGSKWLHSKGEVTRYD